MDDTTSYNRRTLLAAVGTMLASSGAVSAVPDGDRGAQVTQSARNGTASGARTGGSRAPTRMRAPATTVDNGIVVQFRDCSRVRIFGNPLAADLVSVFVGYYDANGRWTDGVYDAEADLPMTIDANEAIGDDAASQVVIGGVDVFEETDSGPAQLVTAQPPDGWSCYDAPEQP